MKKVEKSFLIGCVIGDGCLYKNIKSKSVSFKLTHSIKQKDYFLWKVDKLRTILNSQTKSKIQFRDCYHKNTGKIYKQINWGKGHRYFRILRKWMYINNKKTITKFILNKLTPEAIAIWYMDDGSLTYKKEKGIIHAREFTLNTYISKEENQIIVDYFINKWNIKMAIYKSKNHYRLRFGGKEGWKFIKLIDPYIHKSMLYKIDMKYKDFMNEKFQNFLLT